MRLLSYERSQAKLRISKMRSSRNRETLSLSGFSGSGLSSNFPLLRNVSQAFSFSLPLIKFRSSRSNMQAAAPFLGCVCNGRPMQTNFNAVDGKHLVLQIDQPSSVSELCLVMLRSDIPADHGFAVYWAPPPFQSYQCELSSSAASLRFCSCCCDSNVFAIAAPVSLYARHSQRSPFMFSC